MKILKVFTNNKNQLLHYIIHPKAYTMKLKKPHYVFFLQTLFFIPAIVFSQGTQVTGTVTDSSGAPIAKASVLVKNTTLGTQTSANGTFSINVPQTATTLFISSVGFESQEVPIGNGNVTVSLQQNSSSLANIVIVSIGYGTLNKREVSSAITHLSAKDLNGEGVF